MPYLSYVGAEYPEKIFFITGLTCSGLMFFPVMLANQAGLLYLRTKNKQVHRLAHLGIFFSLLSSVSLSLLSIFDAESYNTLHYGFALTFFTASFVWELCEGAADFIWYREDPSNRALRRSDVLKGALLLCHAGVLVAFIVLSTIDNCDYLMSMENYSECPTHHTAAAVTQYIVLGFILLYIACLNFKKYEESVLASPEYHDYAIRQKTVGHHSHTDPEQPASSARDSTSPAFSRLSDDRGSTGAARGPSEDNSSYRGGFGGGGGGGGGGKRTSIDSRLSDVSSTIDSMPDTPLFSSSAAANSSSLGAGGRRGSAPVVRRKASLADAYGIPTHSTIPEETQAPSQGGLYPPVASSASARPGKRGGAAPATASFRSSRSEYSDSEENVAMAQVGPGALRPPSIVLDRSPSPEPSAPALVPGAGARRRSIVADPSTPTSASGSGMSAPPFDTVKPF